jgi:hypothetical protein
MEIKTKRYLMFLIGCIGTRFLLTYIAKIINIDYIKYISLVTGLIGLSFIYIYLFGSKTADKQLEWTGDKTIWWNDLRIVHGALYLLFTYLALMQNKDAWLILLVDTLIGLISWMKHHKIINI